MGQDDSSPNEDSQAPGHLGNPLLKDKTVPVSPITDHYRVSAGPPGLRKRGGEGVTQLSGWT